MKIKYVRDNKPSTWFFLILAGLLIGLLIQSVIHPDHFRPPTQSLQQQCDNHCMKEYPGSEFNYIHYWATDTKYEHPLCVCSSGMVTPP